MCFNPTPSSAFCLCVSSVGRLYQVEYAMEAIGHAGTCLGILANDGVLLAAERRNIHKLLDEVFFSEKIYKLNEWVASASTSSSRFYTTGQVNRSYTLKGHGVIVWIHFNSDVFLQLLANGWNQEVDHIIRYTLILHHSISLQRHGLQCGRNHIRCQCIDQWAETYSTAVSFGQEDILGASCGFCQTKIINN